MGEHVSLSSAQYVGTSSSSRSPRVANNDEGSFGIEYEAGCRSSSTFRLMQVKGLPQWANKGCVNIRGVIQVRNPLHIGDFAGELLCELVLCLLYLLMYLGSEYFSLFPRLVPSQTCMFLLCQCRAMFR